jgi:hypothetical protein
VWVGLGLVRIVVGIAFLLTALGVGLGIKSDCFPTLLTVATQ